MTQVDRCKGCDAVIEQPRKQGRRRIWCSDKCRKRTLYSGVCIDCGGRTDGVASGYAKESTRCRECAQSIHAERNERIFSAWEEGEPAWLIAEREGMTQGAVISLTVMHRKKGRAIPLHRLRSREAWPELVRLREAGLNNKEIAERMGMNSATCVFQMFAAMEEAGEQVPPNPYRARGQERAERIMALWAEGLTLAEIGEDIGWKQSSVGSRITQLRQQGYDIPYRCKAAA